MADVSFEDEIIERVRRLDAEKQRRVLDFVRHLERRKAITGKEFLEATRHIKFSPEDLAEMEAAIEALDEYVCPNCGEKFRV